MLVRHRDKGVDMSNPFNPAPGATPARIIGREAELAAIREASRRAEISEAVTPLVFIGQRGIGKTVLLRAVR
jgi:Cdc6-like AAA superfamily ATPase